VKLNGYRGRDAHCWAPPRTDPGVHDSRTGLPPWVINEEAHTGNSSHTIKPLGHAHPAQSPARALLSRVPLGPLPWLCQLRA